MKNSEILILTEARNTNPNGDPSNENRPRFTDDGRVEITDLRLKRYIREYINKYVDGKEAAIKSIDEVTENNISSHLKYYVKEIIGQNKDWKEIFESKEKEKLIEKHKAKLEKFYLEKFIDIPLFGIVTGSEGSANTDISFLKPNYYGTVQYQYGFSLNKPLLKDIDISPITGTLGKDYRIDYGVFAFYGVVNKKTGESYKLDGSIIDEMDKWIVNGIPIISAESRSKIGQDVLFYFRIEYKDGNLPRDLRDYISIDKEVDIKSVSDFKIKANSLMEYCESKKDTIGRIIVYYNSKLKLEGFKIPQETGEIQLKDKKVKIELIEAQV